MPHCSSHTHHWRNSRRNARRSKSGRMRRAQPIAEKAGLQCPRCVGPMPATGTVGWSNFLRSYAGNRCRSVAVRLIRTGDCPPETRGLAGRLDRNRESHFYSGPRSASRIAMDFGGIDRSSGKSKQNARWLTGAFRTGPSSWDLVRLSATVRGIATAGRQAASETGKIQHVNRPAAHCT
jgi:hypothetical protein